METLWFFVAFTIVGWLWNAIIWREFTEDGSNALGLVTLRPLIIIPWSAGVIMMVYLTGIILLLAICGIGYVIVTAFTEFAKLIPKP